MREHDKQVSRREFIQQTATIGVGIMLAGTSQLFAETNQGKGTSMNIKSKGYAAGTLQASCRLGNLSADRWEITTY